jgi:DNA polymerase eta
MSSSQQFVQSSPIDPTDARRGKSRFTFKHFSQLGLYSTACPLRVIAHIDLDAFYAQCEGIRLGIAEDQPLAVQQWQGLIAINYPARAFGMNRFIPIAEAKKLCPNIILQHVATWKEGDEKWAYHPDAFAHIATHKVSLDPYRRESKKILACIKENLPKHTQRVEKASIDEVFLDLSGHVHSLMLERYPQLAGPPPYDDPLERLPRPPTTALEWSTDALVNLDTHETEDDDPDWDDIALSIASEIVRDVRKAIREELKYTCSAGIARNKMLSKLGSAHKKPNNQTIIRNRAVQQFLSGTKFTKIRNLGGKLGDQIVSLWGSDMLDELLKIPIEQLKSKIGDDTGTWVYQTIRGEDSSDVNSRTLIKSMLSAKSFRPSINTFEQGARWLRIFCADIFSRLVEEGVLENKRRPKTMNLHHRQGGVTRSRSIPIPQGKAIDENGLFELAKTLLGQIVVDGRAWPCANLSLSVGGFEEGPTGNRGIGSFLVKGTEAKMMRERPSSVGDEMPLSNKRRRIDGSATATSGSGDGGISRFLTFSHKDTSTETYDEDFGAEDDLHTPDADGHLPPATSEERTSLFLPNTTAEPTPEPPASPQTALQTFLCPKCSARLPRTDAFEHEDWHFARELQAKDRAANVSAAGSSRVQHDIVGGSKKGKGSIARRGPKKPGGGSGGTEKGQRKLAFG